MRPLRVLHVTPYYADAWAYGGIPRVVATVTRGLARRGHQVTICATDACDESLRLARPRAFTRDGVAVRLFPNVSNRLAYRFQLFLPVGLGEYLERHAVDFDVAHVHACRNFPGAIAARQLRRVGVPYVLAPNGTAPVIERRQRAKRVFDLLIGRRVMSEASRMLAVSDAERQQLLACGIDDARIRLIPNPVDLVEAETSSARAVFRTKHALADAPVVMFLGQLTPRKRVDVLVRALARLARPDVRLVIAGNDNGAGPSVRSMVARLGLANQTIFTGLLRAGERLEALSAADVVVYPSEHEVFGLVPLEALLSGTPVVVAGDSGCGEIVRPTGGGQVVRVGDDAALARAIECVLASPDVWRLAARRAAADVRGRFSEDGVCEQIENLYAEITNIGNEREHVVVRACDALSIAR